ncbi:serine/threonine protein kinase [Usitatibacter palustris]|uniref:non-specific serine/threonine protein kinase n=1 Tax=Usitatibacter palustris TaxID=2732487 RepID=A0A6M4HBA7_9PROT|nr:serine/threonine-protein kinase [Usitatibacter palustris]QJR16138.1 Serine/threonine-protein kinase PknD [Usitatibacter palustris]
MADTIPPKIGKYKITRALGKGAMGMVYEGFDPIIERRVAVKTILAEYLEAAEMQEAIARFKREAQAGGRLQHPGIVGVYEYGDENDMAYIVMEYVDGQELRSFFKEQRRFELIDIFEIMKQLLAALDYSHKQGVVHRDIKPANLMIMPGPKVKIMDFGIARLESSSLTQVGTVVGTPTHMAPEQLMGIPADGRADLWSSGVILYELLTGRSPFIAETPAAVMHKVLQVSPEPPSSINAALPQGFDAVVARALAKKADDRFPGAKEFQIALLQALQGKTVSGAPVRSDPERTLAPHAAAKAELTRTKMPMPPPAKAELSLSPETIAELERSLSRHIGPLAKVLIKRGQGEATSIEDFCQMLAENIPTGEERKAFLAKVSKLRASEPGKTQPLPSSTQTATPPSHRTRINFTPETLARAEKQLASYVGPLARVLIKEAASKSGNMRELYTQLAAHIDSDEERQAFLAELGQ